MHNLKSAPAGDKRLFAAATATAAATAAAAAAAAAAPHAEHN
jgi:hypothetical protein